MGWEVGILGSRDSMFKGPEKRNMAHFSLGVAKALGVQRVREEWETRPER